MINFIYGSNGTGKTTRILNELLEKTQKGERCFLIVPDQEVLQFERITLAAFPASSQLNLEILGFSRLYNRICRELGGLSYSYMTKPISSLLMWKSIRDVQYLLQGYKNVAADVSMADMMYQTVCELKSNGITPSMLEAAAKKENSDPALSSRINDIALIYACFDNLVSEKYTDSADDLARLRDVLKYNVFFAGANIYMDSFYSFTAIQHQVIDEFFKQAANVTITIPITSSEDNSISADGVKMSLKYLKRSCEKKEVTETFLTQNMRATSPALAYLSKNLWSIGVPSTDAPKPDGSIVTEKCETPYAEAEAVSAHIRKLLKDGVRCRDIAIIARDTEKYRGILDMSLSKSNIPFFFSQKADLCSFPSVKFIISALKIKKYNWQRLDVITHIKTGMCNVDAREANLFEEYVNTWNISGNRFLVDKWTMNPDGFTQEISERGAKILEAANRVREQIVPPLQKLFAKLDETEDISQMCRIMYEYMSEINLEDKLLDLAQKALERGDLKQAKELSRVYQIMIDTLADVSIALEGETADIEEFAQILKNVFSKTEIASIPTSIDEVTIGSASMLRTNNPKYLFVIGVCEGEFPAASVENGLLSEKDRIALSELGISFLDTADTRASNELMFVQRAFSAPSERLYVFTHKRSINGTSHFPSLAFSRIEKLFPELKPHVYDPSDLDYLVPAPQSAISVRNLISDPQKRASLNKALEEHIPSIKEFYSRPISIDKCTVSAENMKAISGNDIIYFSPTSFERYVSCPFKYFCSNILDLREPKSSDFNNANIGKFVHHVMEVLIKHAIPDDPNKAINDEDIKPLVDKTVEEYIQSICPEEMLDSDRLKHLYSRLKAQSLLLIENVIKEFSQSKFRPKFFEFSANDKRDNTSALVFSLDDASKVSFTGIIDRVDVYKKDGDVYIRIVDYKTGTKTFSIEDIKHGINTQMLIYLFTLCKAKSKEFKKALGISPEQKALPAGVTYLSSNIPVIEAKDYESSETILSMAQSSLVRSGILLNDDEILRALNSELDPKFIPGIKKLKNPIGFLTDHEGFNGIYDSLNETVSKIGSELKRGVADARPLNYGDSPCEYCPSKLVCKNVYK